MTHFNSKRRKKAHVENETIKDLQSLCENFPNVSKTWQVFKFPSFLKLRRNLMTSDGVHSVIQEIIVCEHK